MGNQKQNILVLSVENGKEYDRIYRIRNKERIREYNKPTYVKRHLLLKRRNKESVIQYKGGKCEMCGTLFDGMNSAIFELHHTGPSQIEVTMRVYLLRVYKDEIDKCILLCKNCHALPHYQLTNEKYGLE